MSAFNTIHVFGFGDTQIIGKDTNGAIKSDTLTKLKAFIDHIITFKPAEVILTDYHVIHIFNGMEVRYLGKDKKGNDDRTDFSVKFDHVDHSILNELVDELTAAVAAKKAAKVAEALAKPNN